MRIVSGLYRGRLLITPQDKSIRPTLDRVRQAIFTALESRHYIRDKIVCDAFCGTGALGFEALSRGAARCIFIDHDKNNLKIARENAKNLKCEDMCEFIHGCAFDHAAQMRDVNLWCLDPPYHQGFIDRMIKAIPRSDDVIVMAEMEVNARPTFDEGAVFFDRIYASSRIVMLHHRPKIEINQ